MSLEDPPYQDQARCLLELPDELILAVSESFHPTVEPHSNGESLTTSTKAFAALALTCRKLYFMPTPVLYSRYELRKDQLLPQAFCRSISMRPELAGHINTLLTVNRRELYKTEHNDLYNITHFKPIKVHEKQRIMNWIQFARWKELLEEEEKEN
ncbi:hypothetical protein P154DRAFT_536903 [Amniculicola lignicola CBS 123094]|uniref:Uncharacterized protein n=1 Tax=Amniculicola lignicola CBS 123094 TaxID=1392246 RepID=A0A6A5WJ40_9PLEO|nr:hypothetical protein P154DRAFT_536903 [Amniculicola lignicola CBS 123094]